jgi:hypothetical protein
MSERTLSPSDILPVRAAVSNAFAALRKKGFIARANFSCCIGCAVHELTEMAHVRKKDRAVYYHRQDAESFREGFPLHIRFFYLPTESDDTDSTAQEKAVGEQVAAALRNQHLRIEWDGNPQRTIQITGIE